MSSAHVDVQRILEKRHHNGGDHWATEDGRIYVGNPYSTLSSLLMLHELGVDRTHEAVEGGLGLVLEACRDDGRIRVGPRSPMYPCYTGEATRVLCRYGLHRDERVERVVAYFLDAAHQGGGWRCSFSRFGKGPETKCANPGATLYVLDALRFTDVCGTGTAAAAVDFLLHHWEVRKPIGPCHWGIGSRFLRVEFPFLRYNLFFWLYVLSFYGSAQDDVRFLDAYGVLRETLDDQGRVVVEHRHRALKRLDFCARGEPSKAATRRLREIEDNLAGTSAEARADSKGPRPVAESPPVSRGESGSTAIRSVCGGPLADATGGECRGIRRSRRMGRATAGSVRKDAHLAARGPGAPIFPSGNTTPRSGPPTHAATRPTPPWAAARARYARPLPRPG